MRTYDNFDKVTEQMRCSNSRFTGNGSDVYTNARGHGSALAAFAATERASGQGKARRDLHGMKLVGDAARPG